MPSRLQILTRLAMNSSVFWPQASPTAEWPRHACHASRHASRVPCHASGAVRATPCHASSVVMRRNGHDPRSKATHSHSPKSDAHIGKHQAMQKAPCCIGAEVGGWLLTPQPNQYQKKKCENRSFHFDQTFHHFAIFNFFGQQMTYFLNQHVPKVTKITILKLVHPDPQNAQIECSLLSFCVYISMISNQPIR